MRLRAVISAAFVLVGCTLVAKAFTLPYAEFCDAAQSCAGNHLPSLVSDMNYEVSWLIVAPALSIVLAIVALAGLIVVRSPVARASASAKLMVAGVVTLAFFVWLHDEYAFPGRPGPIVGVVGGMLIMVAGLAAATGLLRVGTRAE